MHSESRLIGLTGSSNQVPSPYVGVFRWHTTRTLRMYKTFTCLRIELARSCFNILRYQRGIGVKGLVKTTLLIEGRNQSTIDVYIFSVDSRITLFRTAWTIIITVCKGHPNVFQMMMTTILNIQSHELKNGFHMSTPTTRQHSR